MALDSDDIFEGLPACSNCGCRKNEVERPKCQVCGTPYSHEEILAVLPTARKLLAVAESKLEYVETANKLGYTDMATKYLRQASGLRRMAEYMDRNGMGNLHPSMWTEAIRAIRAGGYFGIGTGPGAGSRRATPNPAPEIRTVLLEAERPKGWAAVLEWFLPARHRDGGKSAARGLFKFFTGR